MARRRPCARGDRPPDRAPAGIRGQILFAPSGPLQELSLSSGWGDEYLALADRFDALGLIAARFLCSVCGEQAGVVELLDDELRRETFTGVLAQPLGARAMAQVRQALETGDAHALYTLDAEYVPFWCPDCSACCCGAHWQSWDVIDEDDPDLHDSIRGRCPQGHERMLED